MKTFVISGVSMTEGGILTVLRSILEAAEKELGDDWRIIALVHDRTLFGFSGKITFLEFPKVKASWLYRIYFELFTSFRISKEYSANIWLCAHDMTARIACGRQFVYAHNPASFKKPEFRDLWFDPIFFIHSLLYRYVYGFRISRNSAVFVQQTWIAKEFVRRYGAINLCVARPVKGCSSARVSGDQYKSRSLKTWIYPTFPRHFKNIEIACEAMLQLQNRNSDVRLIVTIDGNENKYSRYIFKKYASVSNIQFIGLLTKETLNQTYEMVDGVLFPSKLETWGLPLSEAMERGLFVVAADLPYAREVIGAYADGAFFNADDSVGLADLLERLAADRSLVRMHSPAVENFSHRIDGWSELLRYVAAYAEDQ